LQSDLLFQLSKGGLNGRFSLISASPRQCPLPGVRAERSATPGNDDGSALAITTYHEGDGRRASPLARHPFALECRQMIREASPQTLTVVMDLQGFGSYREEEISSLAKPKVLATGE
jgi:hypothetical protein